MGTPPINVFSGNVSDGKLYIGKDAVLNTSGIPNMEVYVGIRPEGFLLSENGSLCCAMGGVEVMGRDISIVSMNEASLNFSIRSIISSDSKVDENAAFVHFALKPNKVLLFDKKTEKRITF